jgi:hypothetical protein
MKEEFRFQYKGVEYDASDYADKHPGGLSFLQNMKAVKKDFTEYFRYISVKPEPSTPTTPRRYSKVSGRSRSTPLPESPRNTCRSTGRWKTTMLRFGLLKFYSLYSSPPPGSSVSPVPTHS